MKYSIIILFFLAGCNHASFKHTASDTTQTTALYMLQNGSINGSIVFRISEDSLRLDTANKNEPKLTWQRDTSYYVPVNEPLFDSLHHPVIDSITKQQKTALQFVKTDRRNILQDYNRTFKN